jgi:hypothetical protein
MKCPRKKKFQSAPLEEQNRATIFQDEKGYSCGVAALGNISGLSQLYWNKATSECYLCQVCPTRKISELVPPWQCPATHCCVGTTEAFTHFGLRQLPNWTYYSDLEKSDFQLFGCLQTACKATIT